MSTLYAVFYRGEVPEDLRCGVVVGSAIQITPVRFESRLMLRCIDDVKPPPSCTFIRVLNRRGMPLMQCEPYALPISDFEIRTLATWRQRRKLDTLRRTA